MSIKNERSLYFFLDTPPLSPVFIHQDHRLTGHVCDTKHTKAKGAPMDFAISEKMKIIIQMIDEFVEKELIPLEPEFLTRPTHELLPRLREKQKLVKQMELWAPCHPQKYGGMGLNLMEHAPGVPKPWAEAPWVTISSGARPRDVGNIEILDLFATPSQKERYLLPLVQGEIRSCFSMTEVNLAGSNPLLMDTTAVPDGDDYVINGQKWYTTAADGAAFAIVMAKTNPESRSLPPGQHDTGAL